MNSEVSAKFEGFSQAAENNQSVILEQLEPRLHAGDRVLEIGSGAGQHAFHFASSLPEIVWQPSDRGDYFELLTINLTPSLLPNLLAPVYCGAAETRSVEWHAEFNAVYCANVFHIMAFDLMADLIRKISNALVPGGQFLVYGPYKYGGDFTTASNARFDELLKARDPLSGIRDIENLKEIAAGADLGFTKDDAMPANNQFLVFTKGG
ncbi:MAG: SAM-dependent methyltransferase [Candidatus Azotimanducaceae bacterium]|jgi:SAM-dependent methyltransferase